MEEYEKLYFDYRKKSEIREKLLNLLKNKNEKVKYDSLPNIKSKNNAGKISKETLDITINYFNCMRYIAGIPHDVNIGKEYQELAQAGSFLCNVNNLLQHSGQPKPRIMNDKLFKLGDTGCNSCNLGSGDSNLMDAIDGWIEDYGNFDTMGHRRWVLYPPMKSTGFGFSGHYTSMYCFDNTFQNSKYKNVAWPPQNCPVEIFLDNTAWTISLGKKIKCSSDLEVNLTNYQTGKNIKFSKKINSRKFNIFNDNYGQIGCIAFKPDLSYKDGDSYRVDIKGTGLAISYDVKFFSVNCHHSGELIEYIEPTCIKKGSKTFYCELCGIKKTEEIDMIPHNFQIVDNIDPTCIKKGNQNLICDFCFKRSKIEIDMIPHDYDYKVIDENGKSEGNCNFCKKKINFVSPTEIKFFWRNDITTEGNSYWGHIPESNPIDSNILCWIYDINGDKNYREVEFKISNPNLLQFSGDSYNEKIFKVKDKGSVELILYPKYNPELKYAFSIDLN